MRGIGILRLVMAWAMLIALPVGAQALCDVTYKVQPGDTLFSIAETHYGTSQQWALVYYANQVVLEGQTAVPGSDVYIPCPASEAAPAQMPPREVGAELTLLTAGNYLPFSDRNWPGKGLATELVTAALEASPSPLPYAVAWEDDWSSHLFPLLDQKTYDMGFPWVKPDCTATPDNERCKKFHFSEPLMELPIMLFKREGSEFAYESDADVIGKRLCRPAGYFTHDLDRADRRWLSEGKITLVQPDSPEDCFEQLMADKVDAVTVNVFLGASKIVAMGLRGRVIPLERALSRESLHVIISKTHWRGTTHLYRINAGLAALRENGRYDEIVSRHLELFWEQVK
ncbi:transporter substrate-binding domain-containing protein [Roseovarius sp. A21]|uniref:Transporter substrate-binding domain-containing protein n=1 Tax=Roseovarius bejariae TaxID=2576383 RepID=A0A844CMV9_9RHOB|nr:transporter substrate-binding domain-containing protein [Roseovarius bejariae]MRU16127.1 transporter substrate-binding domain-containing protein [Roseovarius bejariae]